jgi:hypothetical protein
MGRSNPETLFLDVGGGQIDGDVGRRNVVTAVFQRGTNPIAALPNRRVWKADRVEVIFIGLDAGDVHLNLDDAGVNAIHRCAQGLIKHEVVCSQTDRSTPSHHDQ